MKTSKDQLDYNFSRSVDFQKKIENIKDEDIEDLGLNNISPIKKKHLKFLITDLFSAWKESPSQFLSVSMSKRGYKANSRYNPNRISSLTIEGIKILKEKKLIEFHPGFFDLKRKVSRQSRIKAKGQLVDMFEHYNITANDILFSKNREFIFLLNKDKKFSEYTDNFETYEIREILKNYNNLISKTFFDIPCVKDNYIKRTDNSKIIISDFCKCENLVFRERILKNYIFSGSWWHKLDYITINNLSNHMIINDSDTSYLNLSDLYLVLLKRKTGISLGEFDIEIIKKKFRFIKNSKILYFILNKLINSSSFPGFFRSFSNSRKKIGIDEVIPKKVIEQFIDYLKKNHYNFYKLLYSNIFEWDATMSEIFHKLLKNFGSANLNIPIIKVKDFFFYPNQVENNFINYFEIVLSKDMKLLKYKLTKKKCYSYKKSNGKSIFNSLISNNLNYSDRYKNNKQKFIKSMKLNGFWNNHPMN